MDNPARQTFVSEMVPRTSLANAVSLNSASFNAARIIGPGVAGLVIAAVGTGPAFFVNTLSFVAVLLALTQMKTELLRPAPRSRGKGQIRDGLRYVRGRPDIILIMVLVFVLGTFGMNFQLTTALMATQQFHKGAGEYGLLGSIMAIGSLSAALLSARRPRPRLRILLVALAGFVVSSGAAALAPSYVWFAVLLVPVGLSALTVLTSANSMVQLGVDPQMRGRVMALYMAIFMGGTPLGAPLIGWIGAVGARAGPSWSGPWRWRSPWWVRRSTSCAARASRVRYQLRDRPHLLVTRDEAASRCRRPRPDDAALPPRHRPGGPRGPAAGGRARVPAALRPRSRTRGGVPAVAATRQRRTARCRSWTGHRAVRRGRGRAQPCVCATTCSMQAISADTSSGSTAGNIATRSWLRPSLR